MRKNVSLLFNSAVPKGVLERLLSTHFAGTPLEGTPEDEEYYATGLLVSADRRQCELDDEELPESDAVRTNGETTIAKYDLGEAVVIVETGVNMAVSIEPIGTTIWDYLQGWEFGDDVDRSEGLTAFGYDVIPDEAADSATNVRIWRSPNFSDKLLPETYADYVRNESGEPLVFGTVAEARNWIEQVAKEPYFLASGEMDRPDYTVVE